MKYILWKYSKRNLYSFSIS